MTSQGIRGILCDVTVDEGQVQAASLRAHTDFKTSQDIVYFIIMWMKSKCLSHLTFLFISVDTLHGFDLTVMDFMDPTRMNGKERMRTGL